ncbi:MAG: VWA domain-containing protein [Tistlia sp.]|uniref:VWA domain-containing protein n=1 Tax=Tistlia sp. TaxID=3057121 RepID=UPI0034A3967C
MPAADPFADAQLRLRQDSRLAELAGRPEEGRLAENILYFVRTLRAAGLPVGPGRLLAAVEAVRAVGLDRRDDFYWALHAALVERRDQREIFDQAFQIFWRNPKFLDRLRGLLLPDITPPDQREERRKELSRRLADALAAKQRGEAPAERQEEIELDAVMTWSDRESFREQDFEQMSAEELARAQQAVKRLALPLRKVATRRFEPSHRPPRADLRATLRAGLREGGDLLELRWKKRRHRPPPLVVLCDISGSMSRYSRIFLHFMHAVTSDRDRVHSFVFGTRLTNLTRYLRQRDIDQALERCAGSVTDWSGGTRIGACLADFNRTWARRVLGQGAIVLLISDGLDREGAEGVAREMERLHKSCRRLIWLNPLLRYEGYAPKSMGAKAMLPHVDDFRSVHNLDSLEQLAAALSDLPKRRQEAASLWPQEVGA